jgi:LytTr DNA-binding domain
MKSWDLILPNRVFFRIHRSSIINLERLHRLKKNHSGGCWVYLSGIPEPFEISRRLLSGLKKVMQIMVQISLKAGIANPALYSSGLIFRLKEKPNTTTYHKYHTV